MCPFGPTFFNRDVSFVPGLQASRSCFDSEWTLEAVKGKNGNPPAIFVQVIIGCIRLKRAHGEHFAPHVFLLQNEQNVNFLGF